MMRAEKVIRMRILVSACLLDCACRYDGKRKGLPALLELAKEHTLIPCCPEQLGGLPTPRPPAERRGERVVNAAGADVTEQYVKGAEEALGLAQRLHCGCAILKERSPSCGAGEVYDGTFTHTLTTGDGVAAALLKANGIPVFGESELEEFL